MEKLQQYTHVFRQLDKNGDGKLSAPELQICIGKVGGELTLEEAEIAAAMMDSDGDGLLSMEDLIKVVEDANEEEKANDLKMAFKITVDDCKGDDVVMKN
ncbi:unnamed protein product [Lactuca virosa]|uniref:EF-hand domain-containing protein n=1 Tax=Lactuca virosa TaxID=75947 RepID=A0AAU9LBT3_9ASTR|nr:unnamed protein product [Lactuca virosa]